MNAKFAAEGRPELFCLPQHFSLDADVILSVLDQEIRQPLRKGWPEDTPVELILVQAFIDSFPCK
jgi:hypothetical protein